MTRQCDHTVAERLLSSRDRGTLEAIHAEEVARARLDEQETRLARDGRTQLTRKTAAMLRATHEETVDGRSSKRRRRDHDEERALRETFGIDADSDDSTGSKDKRSFSGDDSDYEENPEPSSDSDGDAEEPTQAACDSDDDSGEDSSDESKPTEAPNLHQTPPRTRSARRTGPVWFYGIKTTFASWEEFDRCFDEFQKDSFQQFSKRTSTSVTTRNKQIIRTAEERRLAGKKSRKEVKFVPDEWVTYTKTFLCTHGQPYEPRGTGKRSHNKVRDTKCGARVNLCVTAASHGRWVLRAKGSGIHNHELSQHMWESYAENRVVEDVQLKNDVVVLHKAGANAHGILQYLRERTGKKTILRDVHNMVQRHKIKEQDDLTDAQRAFAVLDEFCGQNSSNSAEVVLDSDSNVARIVTFQTARMKRLFKAFPEVIMVDSTHNTNANRYKLFSFVVHDVFGKGQYVHHVLVDSEHKDNLRRVVEIFKENNPEWTNIQVVMSDKAVHEKDVLREMLPQARQLLCQWHVITWLKKQAARLAKPVKKEVKALMRLLVYAESAQEYEEAKGAMLQKLGGDTAHELYQTFLKNWDNSQEEWVSYRRGNVPHLTNNTNNRIESKWGKIKDIINDSFSIDQLLSTLVTLQEYAEEQYLSEYHRVGSRPARASEDPELSRLGLQLSPFAFDLVSKQHALATGREADYGVELREEGKAMVTSPRSGNVHVVNTKTSTCGCIFMQTCLLPCRHVMYVRSVGNYESIIPPMRCFPTRWIVHSPENDIGNGETPCGGLKQSSCDPLPKERALSSTAMYCEAKATMEKIVDRMSLQSTPTFRVALKWLDRFYEALNSGRVVDFTEFHDPDFPGLSQVSSVGGAQISQISLADATSSICGADNETSDIAATIAATSPTVSPSVERNEDDGSVKTTNLDAPCGSLPDATEPPADVANSLPNATESTPKTTKRVKTSKEADKTVTWSFADHPVINGMTKAQRKEAQAKKDRQVARQLAAEYRRGKMSRFVTFAEVAALLDGPYSFFDAKSMVDALVLPEVEVTGLLSVRQRGAGQEIPDIKAVPQLPKVTEAIDAIRIRQDIDLLAYWPDYGYATFDQLDAMTTLVEARNRFNLVMRTIMWIENLEWRVSDLRQPFSDTRATTKNEHVGYVETLNLSVNRVPGEVIGGHQLLDFRENLWLHTTSILVSLMVLRDEYADVGMISPTFHDFVLPEQRRRTAGGFGASDPNNKRVVCIFHIQHHWVAFLVDRNIDVNTNKATCYMFDPLQSKRNYKIIENSVRTVVEQLLQLEDMINYQKVEWCTQRDGSSCGVWCIAILEILLSNSTWDDCIYNLVPYLRMRFLHKAVAFVGKGTAQ